jgi:hypothetical protein
LLGAVSVLSLSTRVILSSGRYSPHRYSDVGGPFLGAIDMVVAFGCGVILGVGLSVRIANRGAENHSWRWYLDALPGSVLAYLIYAANFS